MPCLVGSGTIHRKRFGKMTGSLCGGDTRLVNWMFAAGSKNLEKSNAYCGAYFVGKYLKIYEIACLCSCGAVFSTRLSTDLVDHFGDDYMWRIIDDFMTLYRRLKDDANSSSLMHYPAGGRAGSNASPGVHGLARSS
jgi:hypothetical protein